MHRFAYRLRGGGSVGSGRDSELDFAIVTQCPSGRASGHEEAPAWWFKTRETPPVATRHTPLEEFIRQGGRLIQLRRCSLFHFPRNAGDERSSFNFRAHVSCCLAVTTIQSVDRGVTLLDVTSLALGHPDQR